MRQLHNTMSWAIPSRPQSSAWRRLPYCVPHIINYARPREVYVAYRKAGYSRKFREEHEQEILLRQAAKKKNAFDEMGVKKLPKVKRPASRVCKAAGGKEENLRRVPALP